MMAFSNIICKPIMKYSLVLVTLLIVSANCFSEKPSKYSRLTSARYPNYFGICAGISEGVGLSYRRWINNSFAAQLSGFYLQRNDKYTGEVVGYEKTVITDFGCSGFYNLRDWRYCRALVDVGLAYLKDNDIHNKHIYIESVDIPFDTYHKFTELLFLGSDIGIDFFIWRLCFNAMVGGGLGYNFVEKRISLEPSINLGAYARF
jgi:hypothetical protein